ncbi:DMT family transporter [Lederbergia citrea]|uniref:DMT family transporter n=1 Tax=Lederbergia citrea TaxID=2833581 RepID=UPI001BC909CB|nr:EamA family transporter [Lederbergia citrea]MBS4203172.1 EamA family transporter [Lederbergia citrea]
MPQFFVLLAAMLWGTIAIFVKQLTQFGFTEMEIVTIRVLFAFIWLIPVILLQQKEVSLKIDIRHLWYFVGTGLCSIVFFNWAYFKAINIMSISIAVMLLYTAPAFVAILSVIILKESMSKKKIAAIAVTITGCAIIALTGSGAQGEWSIVGFMIGLCSGLGYALYTIFGKLALRDYDSLIITFYTFLTATICLIAFFPFWKKAVALPLEAWLYMGGLGLLPTVLAYLLYTNGLKKIDSSIASIFATVEPVAAVFFGISLYQEKLFTGQVIGAMLILSSILIISEKKKNRSILE